MNMLKPKNTFVNRDKRMLQILMLLVPAFFAMQIYGQENTAGEISSEGFRDTVVIGSEPNYPPYCIVDENGNATGFSVEIFKAAAAAVNLEVEIKPGLWSSIRANLLDEKLDALPIMARTPGREADFDFTLPYISLHGTVFVRKNNNNIRSLNDLYGKEILVMKHDNAEEFVLREKITDKVFSTSTAQEAFLHLADGKHDALMIQHLTGLKVIEELGLTNIEPVSFEVPGFVENYCFAVKEGNTEMLTLLNEGLTLIIANDTYNKIYFNWFGPPPGTVESSLRNILFKSLYIIIPLLIAGIILWIIFLRREVRKRTRTLEEEIAQHKKTFLSLEQQKNQLKEQEKHIRMLLNSTAEGIFGTDNQGKCIFMNRSALKLLKFSDEKEVIGKPLHKLIHHSNPDGTPMPEEVCEIAKSYRDGRSSRVDTEHLWRSDGTSFPVIYFSYPVKENGNITGAVVTFLDVTEQKKAEEELIRLKNDLELQVKQRTTELADKVEKLDNSQRAMLYMVEDLNQITLELKQERARLKETNTELEAFTYSVSHDLRAPLRAIGGYSGFLLEDYAEKLDDEGKRFIQTIQDNASKMDRLITDLLNLSRVSRNNLNITKTNMKQLAEAILHETATDSQKESFQIVVGDLPPAFCDAGLTKQVWYNLINNALKYSSKSETKQIEIGATENGDEITYYVKDSGIGFDEKFRNKIFGVFQRLHRDSEFEGSGVGLAIVQRIVQRHGGKVWAASEPGRGATFYFSFPKTEFKMIKKK